MPFTIAAPVTATLIGFTTFTPVTGQQVSAPTVETVLFAGTAICTGRALPAVGTTYILTIYEHVLRQSFFCRLLTQKEYKYYP